MGRTLTEKVLARAAGLPDARAGDEVLVKADFILAYDYPNYTDLYFRKMREDYGIERVREPDRYVFFIDHFLPPTSPADEMLHIGTRQWCAENGVALFERRGIGHQVAVEEGYAAPGAFVLHFDIGVSQLGAYGALAIGIRGTVLDAYINDYVLMQVPETVRVNLTGALPKGVMARDVIHHLVRVMGSTSCRYKVLELGGPAVEAMSLGDLQTITGLAFTLDAVGAVVNPVGQRLEQARAIARKRFEPAVSDPDAQYCAVHEIDLSSLAPTIVLPPHPANIRDLADHLGMPVDCGYIGSSASGRLEDIEAAARILDGRKVKPGFSLNVVPSSSTVMAEAAERGWISILSRAGAFISSPTNDYAIGRIGTMAPGQRGLSTAEFNTPGRMGSPDADIYLASAASVAAAAIDGVVADPRSFL